MAKRVVTAVFIVLIIASGAWYASRFLFKPGVYRYAGTLEATRVDLSARVPTVVSSISVEEGAKVKAGEVLASLACEDIRIAHKLAQDNFVRSERLKKSGAVSLEAFDQVASRKQDADARLAWCDIQSPISGTLLARLHEPGEWVNPGTKILSLANLSDVWAYVYVAPEKIATLKLGMKVSVFLPELGDRTWSGVVRKINEEAEFTPKNVQTRSERSRLVFGVKIAIENKDETLKPGMTVEIALP